MKNDMRGEFEEYVKKLTTAICKDIFLEKLEELYVKYEKEYELYAKAAAQAASAGKSLQKELKGTTSFLKDIDKKTGDSIRQVDEKISRVEASTEQTFNEMRALNEQKLTDFISGISACMDGYQKELSDVFAREEQKISDKLAGIITPEVLGHFLDRLEENTRETKSLAAFVGEEYRSEVEKSIRAIVDANRSAMEETNSAVLAYVDKMTEALEGTQKGAEAAIDGKVKSFQDTMARYIKVESQCFNSFIQAENKSREEALEEQKKLIAQIGPSDEKMDRLERQVIRLEDAVYDMKMDNESAAQSIRLVSEQLLSEKEELALRQLEHNVMKQETAELTRRVHRATAVTTGMVGLVFLLELYRAFGIAGIVVAAGLAVTLPLALRFRKPGKR